MRIRAGARLRLAPALFICLFGFVVAAEALLWRLPGDPAVHPPRPGEAAVTVYVVDHGWHTDLALPAARVLSRRGASADALRRLPERSWVLVGWGDARFYREQGASLRRLLDGLRALFLPGNDSVVQLRVMQTHPLRRYPRDDVAVLQLSEIGFTRLMRRLDSEFALERGRPVDAGHGAWTARSRFFAGTRRFHLFQLCNHFTAGLLNAGGIAVRPVPATLPDGVMADARRAG
jgi:hypothetical protein